MKIFTQTGPEGITRLQFQFDNSFGPFIRFLKEKQDKSTDIRVKFYRYLVKKFEQQPELLQPFDNVAILEEHDDLVQLLRMSLLPLATNTEDVPMALAFMQPSTVFYYTPLFKKTFIDEHIEFNTHVDTNVNLRYFVKLVLERCYGIKSDINRKVIKQIINREKHTLRHHELTIESRFIDVHVNGVLPRFDEAWQRMLNADDEEFAELFAGFPSDSFRLEGFCMLMGQDISEDMAINQVKNAVLNMHNTDLDKTLDEVERAIGELVNDSRFKIGITPFFKINGKLVYDRSFITKCVGLSTNEKDIDKKFSLDEVYEKFSQTSQPLIFQNVDDELINNRPYLCGLLDNEIKSFVVYPIKTRDGLIGVFEVGSPDEDDITPSTVNCLNTAIPLITDLVYYMIETFDTRIERLVKEKFTPLQESVEWKFNEVAWEYLLNEKDQQADETIGNVCFENVYPLYGAVDVRNSSVERNLASKNDYLNQLSETLGILQRTSASVSLPLIDSIQYKCEKFINAIADLLTSEDELNIREFFEQEVYVLFRHIGERNKELAKVIHDYMQKTDLKSGAFHWHHRCYEESMNMINKNMVNYFEEEAKKLQVVYPFYFEKYRTDGVEYNIFIGQSIAPDNRFDSIYLKNLRAWQISSMAHIARINNQVLDSMPLRLQTTQLLLVHGGTIDISFRKDERRFDVEGAYNIRYEILKKRIDKVRVQRTMERLTQPDKIAIVYSNSSEIQEYIHHIHYLQNKGLLTDTLEMLDLENVQGISGLKALRVGVKYVQSNKEDLVAEVSAAM
jgi:hypothetical protein